MDLLAAITALLLSYTPHGDDRSESALARANRMADMGAAIHLVTLAATCSAPFDFDGCQRRWSGSPVALAALLARTAHDETGLSHRIHEGRCYAYECDRGAARGPWQVHAVGPVSRELWNAIDRTPAGTLAGAWAATLIYSGARNQCRGTRIGTISAYATGYSCGWSGAARRERGWTRAESTLRAACAR
jgi:hypothetical protein